MVRLARYETIAPDEINIVHCINRTVRGCFLFGDDSFTGKNFAHRKVWIEEMLKLFAACFGIDLVSNQNVRFRSSCFRSKDGSPFARRSLRTGASDAMPVQVPIELYPKSRKPNATRFSIRLRSVVYAERGVGLARSFESESWRRSIDSSPQPRLALVDLRTLAVRSRIGG